MDTDLLIQALTSNNPKFYFEIREHFPKDLIEAEVAMLKPMFQKKWGELELAWEKQQQQPAFIMNGFSYYALPLPHPEDGGFQVEQQVYHSGMREFGKLLLFVSDEFSHYYWRIQFRDHKPSLVLAQHLSANF